MGLLNSLKYLVFFLALSNFGWVCSAYAIRVARFQVQGQNALLYGFVKSDLEAACSITISNPSNSNQVVQIEVRLYADVPSGMGYATSGTCAPPPAAPVLHNYGVSGPYQTITRTVAAGTQINLKSAPPPINPSGSADGVDCGNLTSSTCTLPTPGAAASASMTFPMICGNTSGTAVKTVQNVRCEGEIKVEDASGAAPGHIVASGTLTTFTESAGGVSLGTDIFGRNVTGGSNKSNAATPTFTPIVIGEGRPF